MQIDSQFLEKYNVAGPRYTSYPPAPHFKTDINPDDWKTLVKDSTGLDDQMSLYFHIPFCPHRCLFCGCSVDIAVAPPIVKDYHAALNKEMDMVFEILDRSRKISQIHFGGGTPNSVKPQYIAQIIDHVKAEFEFTDNIEIAMECDPNLLTEKRIVEYREMGFNRISFGLQDFKQDVLDGVERGFPKLHPSQLISISRDAGYKGINLDLIYGLPRQTVESFADTVQQTIEANPDRIAIFSYAHVPWLKPTQKPLEKLGLPGAEIKNEIAVQTHNVLNQAGYVAIGMDHYAKPEDSLAVALKEKKLHRNFQGYCTRETTGQIYAFGSSAISQLHYGYGQNIKATQPYINKINEGNLPLEKMYTMTEDNLFFREVINSLMCDGELDAADLALKCKLEKSEVKNLLKDGMSQIQQYQDDGLVEVKDEKIKVTEKGWLVVRCIAMLFDPLLAEEKARYSKTV